MDFQFDGWKETWSYLSLYGASIHSIHIQLKKSTEIYTQQAAMFVLWICRCSKSYVPYMRYIFLYEADQRIWGYLPYYGQTLWSNKPIKVFYVFEAESIWDIDNKASVLITIEVYLTSENSCVYFSEEWQWYSYLWQLCTNWPTLQDSEIILITHIDGNEHSWHRISGGSL